MNFYRLAFHGLSAVFALFAATILSPAVADTRDTPLFSDDRTMGTPHAPVVLVEYAAPVCPHCAHFNAEVFPQLKKTYIDTGKVLYVLRIYPITQWDGAVAGMAKCMPPKRYFQFIDLAFRKQAIWDPDGNDIPDVHAGLVKLGGLAGLNPQQVDRCIADKKEQDRINRMAQDGEQKYGVDGVPTLVINGAVLHAEEASWPDLKTRIDGLLATTK